MIARYAVAITIGAGVTFALLFLMQMLIASGRGGVDEVRDFRITDFVRVERDVVAERREQKPERPPEPERPPDMPNPDRDNFSSALAVSISAPSMGAGLNVGLLGFGIRDGEYLPIVRVAPVYPQQAAQRGLEGYVIVEFTVTRTGSTRDVVVIESSNRIFERAAVEAAYKFRYRPRVIDGETVEVPGVQNQFTFVLED
jgi:periplasmic protein TonB